MARSESPRCDVALWDLEQTLLNPIRDQLSQPRHDRTGVLQADIGAWRSRRVAVLSLIETDALKKALHGFEAAHHPRLTLFVATASAREGAHSLGDVVLAKRLIEASSEPLVTSTDWMTPTLEKQSSFKLDDVHVGKASPSSDQPALRCRKQAGAALHAGETLGVNHGLLAVVSDLEDNSSPELPLPTRWKRPLARESGALVGALLHGGLSKLSERKAERKQVHHRLIDSLGQIVEGLP